MKIKNNEFESSQTRQWQQMFISSLPNREINPVPVRMGLGINMMYMFAFCIDTT
jgi:hypothetical protein